MKHILTIALIASSTVLMSLDSNATEKHPWSTFKEVVQTFHTANGEFQNLSTTEQEEFIRASTRIKSRLAKFDDRRAAEKLREISLTESIYRFVWKSKDVDTTIDVNMEIPKPPVEIE